LGAKKIYKYPLGEKLLSVARMVVDGRHPESGYLLEKECNFAMYMTRGKGRYFVGDEIFDVGVGDVVFVPAGNKFASEGDFEYITFDTPGYYPEQSEEVKE